MGNPASFSGSTAFCILILIDVLLHDNNTNYHGWNKALTFGVGSIQLSFHIYHCVHPIHAVKYVFNPNVTTFQSNCAEGLHFSAFIIIIIISSQNKTIQYNDDTNNILKTINNCERSELSGEFNGTDFIYIIIYFRPSVRRAVNVLNVSTCV